MFGIHNLSKSFGIQPILQNINFNISAGERIGLIGPNGSGKTTLMRILAGFDQPDSGKVISTRPGLRVGYLAQGMDFPPEQTLHAALGLDSTPQTDPAAEVESLAVSLSQNPNNPAPAWRAKNRQEGGSQGKVKGEETEPLSQVRGACGQAFTRLEAETGLRRA